MLDRTSILDFCLALCNVSLNTKPCLLVPFFSNPHASLVLTFLPCFNALIDIVRERAAGDEAASPLGHVQVAIFQHDFALADNHQGYPTQLHPFKDVVFGNLDSGMGTKPGV